jgi:ribosomal-protein-alanine N-acetyltransferase
MNFKISPCNKQEYYLIANLEKSLFDSPFSIKDLENMSLQEAFKIWKIYGDSLIGYVCFFQVKNEVEIIKIGIMKSHQGKNYGTYLITKIKKLSIRKIFLEVSSLNKIAIKFYEKNGFKIIGVRKNYYTLRDNSKVNAIRLLYEL